MLLFPEVDSYLLLNVSGLQTSGENFYIVQQVLGKSWRIEMFAYSFIVFSIHIGPLVGEMSSRYKTSDRRCFATDQLSTQNNAKVVGKKTINNTVFE